MCIHVWLHSLYQPQAFTYARGHAPALCDHPPKPARGVGSHLPEPVSGVRCIAVCEHWRVRRGGVRLRRDKLLSGWGADAGLRPARLAVLPPAAAACCQLGINGECDCSAIGSWRPTPRMRDPPY